MQKSPNSSLDRENTLSHEQIKEMAEQHLHQLKKVRRDNERIQKELGTRTISDILASGETFYMGACVDSTLSFLMKLKEHIPAEKLQLGCELLRQNESGNLTFHLFLTDHSRTPQRVIDFVGSNFVSIYEGDYQNPQEGKKITQLGKFSISGEKVEKSDSFLTLADKMGVGLPPELFQAYLGKLQHDNTPENFEHFQKNSPISIKIKRQKESTQNAVLGVVKKFAFLLLSLPLLQACTQKPDLTLEKTENSISSGALQSIPERKDDPNIPNCEPLDLEPINPEDIINIDDVVKNCKYETGHILYNTRLGSSQTLFAKMRIWKNFITYDAPDPYSESTPCEYQGKLYNEIDVYDTPSGSKDDNKSDFLNFLIRNNMQEKKLAEYGSELNDLMRDNTQRHYGCKEKALCKKLIQKTYGQKGNHYFLFSYKSPESREKRLILDDKVYSIGDFDYFSSALPFVKQGPWTPTELKKDKLIIRRYINGKLLDPNKTNYQEKEMMGTFQLQTCEIPL